MFLRVVAEELETEDLVVRVRDLGVDLGQGSSFANPLPLGDAQWLLDQQFALAVADEGLADCVGNRSKSALAERH